jgi:lysophospholipase
MTHALLPDVAPEDQRRRYPPPNWQEQRVTMNDGWSIRFGAAGRPAGPEKTVLLLSGRGDFIEKYWETMHDLVDRQFHVLSFDWRGQGKSGRLGPSPQHCHAQTFDDLLADACALLDGPWADLGGPINLIGHSMGGNMAARLLHARADRFRCAVLLAPMLGIQTGPLPVTLVRRLARLMVKRNRGARYAFGQGAYGPQMQAALRRDRLTSAPERFADEAWFMQSQPELLLGGITFGWLNAAFESIATLQAPGVAEAIRQPLLMLLPEREELVDPEAARRFAARLPHGQVIEFADARHELLRERDSLRLAVLEQVCQFFAESA